MQWPQLSPVEAAIGRLSEKLTTVESQQLAQEHCYGRVLASDLLADRDSPAVDVSAMDGYAIRLADVALTTLPVQATTAAGMPPTELCAGHAVRIFTGAPVPKAADCVVRREDTQETPDSIRLQFGERAPSVGHNIRRRGENGRAGAVVLSAGTLIDAANISAVASFAPAYLSVRQRVRVAIFNTGAELVPPGAAVSDWRVRDSNGPTLQVWLSSLPWVEVVARQQVDDTLSAVCDALQSQIDQCDAIVLTGGVSMGDTDFVPQALQQLGGETVFHRLPIRPGKPVLGGTLGGKLVLGLPGNPVSVAVTARVLGEPLLRHLAGCTSTALRPMVTLANCDQARLELTWYRLVRITEQGQVELIPSRGSGDVVSISHSHGFVEVPPGVLPHGPLRLTLW